MMKRVFAGFLELLAPRRCAACDELLTDGDQGFCGGCALLLDDWHLRSGSDLSACAYGGPVAEALQRLKYRGQLELAPALVALLVPVARELPTVDCVTAVPMWPARLRARGFNQSALLAQGVARALRVPYRPKVLRRIRETAPQVGADRELRTQQLTGAFAAAQVQGQRVLVVDDVRTTGATLREARRALEAAGASAVCTLVVAETPDG